MMFTPQRFTMDGAPPAAPQPAQPARVVEAAGAAGQVEDDTGWTRLSANGGAATGRDLTPMAHERSLKLAEYLWQQNLLANRLIEIALAYLLAEGVQLECDDEQHQALLTRFWHDPINAWPLKLTPRARDLALTGEQCYRVFVNEADGFVRLGYVDPRRIAEVVMDPDNPEQPIGVVTKRDAKGRYEKFRVIVLGDDAELFSRRTATIRQDFGDGEVFLFQVNRLATGSRGRSDLLGQIDWIDAYDEFLFGELDRTRFMRSFVWDLNLKTGTPADVAARARTFAPPAPNSVFVHNDGEELTAVAPELNSADTSTAARLFRNHVLAGATVPEHWFGGGGDVNRAAASEMGEPTFKVLTARQTLLKQMLEEIGRYVLSRQPNARPDWADAKWRVRAVFPELVSKDIAKFAAAMQSVAAAVVILLDKGLVTDERALQLVADVAKRFGQDINAEEELKKAREQLAQRQADLANSDAFTTPGADGNPVGQQQQGGQAGGDGNAAQP